MEEAEGTGVKAVKEEEYYSIKIRLWQTDY
jgi:hypothetical protein